jgi:glycosyltransferase involved in cell wall biosynthesis
VVLFFGLIRPYKGVDVLIDAFGEIDDTELWIVGRPLGMATGDLRERAGGSKSPIRFVERFVSDAELPSYFRRADIVVLPYRDAEQSGVLYTALAFGKPVVMTNVGGFPEVAATGAGTIVPPNDPRALAGALAELLGDSEMRGRLASASAAAAAGPYSWDAIAAQTLELYSRLLEAR